MAGSARPGAATLILHPGADKRKAAMLERFKEYRPKCLFVVDAEGRFCGKPTVASHTIPRANVLEPMMGPDNKVLVTSWGVGSYSHLFMSSSEENPLYLTPSSFNPHPQGIRTATTGQFACCVHERNTFDSIDVAVPDFSDPEVLFMTEYRAYLYAYSLLLWGKWMYDQWDRDIMRSPAIHQRFSWVQKREQIRTLLPQIEAISLRLGKLWREKKRSANTTP